MPRIFDNVEADLLPALEQSLLVSARADFCVSYFNLRGWKTIDRHIEKWADGAGRQCRLLVGMQQLPQDELRAAFSLTQGRTTRRQTFPPPHTSRKILSLFSS